MIDIANEAGVAKGTLYLYFENKEALMQGVIELSIIPTLLEIGKTAQVHTGTAEELLSSQLRIAARRIASSEMKILLRHMISAGPKNQRIAEFYYENVLKKGVGLIKKTLLLGVERGEFKKEAADIDPIVLVGANIYMAVWKILFEDLSPIDTERLVEDQLKLCLRGLTAD